MTLEKVEVNLARAFDSAQLYVARKLFRSSTDFVANFFCSQQSHLFGRLEGHCTSDKNLGWH